MKKNKIPVEKRPHRLTVPSKVTPLPAGRRLAPKSVPPIPEGKFTDVPGQWAFDFDSDDPDALVDLSDGAA